MGRGRPTKLTAAVQKRVCDAIKQGATYALAAQYAGIHRDTLNEWMKAGEEAESGSFSDFSDAVKAAEGQAAITWLRRIEKAASDGNWTAAAWKLERRYPQDYGRQVHEVQGKDGQPLAATVHVHMYVPDNGRDDRQE